MGFNPYKNAALKEDFNARVAFKSGGIRIALKTTTYFDNIEKYEFDQVGVSNQTFGTLVRKKAAVACGAPRTEGGTYLTTGGNSASGHFKEMDVIDVKAGGTATDHGDLDLALRASGSATDCQSMFVIGGRDASIFTDHIDRIQFSTANSAERWGDLAIIAEQVVGYGNDLNAYMDRGVLIGFPTLPRFFQYKCFQSEAGTIVFPTFHPTNRNGHSFVCNESVGFSYGGSFNSDIREIALQTLTGSILWGSLIASPLLATGAASDSIVINIKGSDPNIFNAINDVEYFCMKTRASNAAFITAGSDKTGSGSYGAA